MIWLPWCASLFAWGTGATLAFFVLGVAWCGLLQKLDMPLSTSGVVLFLSTLFIVPIIAVTAGVFLDSKIGRARRIFLLLLLPLTVSLWFKPDTLFNYVDVALDVLKIGSPLLELGYAVALFGAALFLVSGIALVVWLTIMVFEIGVAYLARSAGIRIPVEIFSLRPLLIIFLLALLANMLPGVFSQTLGPTMLTEMMKG